MQGVLQCMCNKISQCSWCAKEERVTRASLLGVNLRDLGTLKFNLRQGRLFRSSEVYGTAEMERYGIKTVLDLRRKSRCCTSPSYGDSTIVEEAEASKMDDSRACTTKAWMFCLSLQSLSKHNREESIFCVWCQYTLQKDLGVDIQIVHADLIPSRVGLSIFQALPMKIQVNAIGAACLGRGAESVLTPAIADESIYGYKALYRTILRESKDGMAMAFRTLANPNSYPILVHCVHGKDRTGLVVMLLLMLAGVGRSEILEDYAASERALRTSRQNDELPLKEFLKTDQVINADREVLSDAITFVHDQYNGAAGYLSSAGLDRREIDSVRANIVRQLC